jgi:hypothetical protein
MVVEGDDDDDPDNVAVDHTVEATLLSGSRVIPFQSAVRASASAMRDLPASPQPFGQHRQGVGSHAEHEVVVRQLGWMWVVNGSGLLVGFGKEDLGSGVWGRKGGVSFQHTVQVSAGAMCELPAFSQPFGLGNTVKVEEVTLNTKWWCEGLLWDLSVYWGVAVVGV